ncbi:MAG: transposase [Chloroflexi bacterium]|nr:transposase [Chloroflexota bacterium]
MIFFNPGNYEYCLRLSKQYAQKYGIAIIAYCLMPNHYHFLIRQETEQPPSKFINALFSAYVQAVNVQQQRKGTLFESRFRHVTVDREEYLTHLCRYIHLNPVKANLVDQPSEWPYSNYLEWVGCRAGTLVDRTFIHQFFKDSAAYRVFVVDYQSEMKARHVPQRYMLDED